MKNVRLAEKLAQSGHVKSARAVVRTRVARGSVVVIEVDRTEKHETTFCARCAKYTRSLLDTKVCWDCGEVKS